MSKYDSDVFLSLNSSEYMSSIAEWNDVFSVSKSSIYLIVLLNLLASIKSNSSYTYTRSKKETNKQRFPADVATSELKIFSKLCVLNQQSISTAFSVLFSLL